MTDIVDAAKSLNAPWLLILVLVGIVASAMIRIAAETSDMVAKLFGPLGKRWQASRDRRIANAASVEELTRDLRAMTKERDEAREAAIEAKRDASYLRDQRDTNAWTKDMERQIANLNREMAYTRRRSEMTDAYLRLDAEYHRWDMLGREGSPPEWMPPGEFERRWVQAHGPLDAE